MGNHLHRRREEAGGGARFWFRSLSGFSDIQGKRNNRSQALPRSAKVSLWQRGFEHGFLAVRAISSSGLARLGANRPSLARVRNHLPRVIHMLAAGFPADWGSLKTPRASF